MKAFVILFVALAMASAQERVKTVEPNTYTVNGVNVADGPAPNNNGVNVQDFPSGGIINPDPGFYQEPRPYPDQYQYPNQYPCQYQYPGAYPEGGVSVDSGFYQGGPQGQQYPAHLYPARPGQHPGARDGATPNK